MSSYSLPRRYQVFGAGMNFFQRQVKSAVNVTKRVVKRGLSKAPSAPPPGGSGLPDFGSTPWYKDQKKLLMYGGGGAAGLVLLMILSGKRRRAVAA